MARIVVGIIGGLFVFVVVTLVLGFLLRNLFDGIDPLDTLIGFILPVVLGLLAGIHSFRKSLWPPNRQ
ncbi:MAG: hypothetical protein GXY44_14425 [Phycisphaerales bacterium]|nr:hypothetical protein [Phycisphaerales bacterium]